MATDMCVHMFWFFMISTYQNVSSMKEGSLLSVLFIAAAPEPRMVQGT